jgi:2-polyprenyl-3-methyl-5-hydroxy-6-metoxy-1,4-benzoquinol methylase
MNFLSALVTKSNRIDHSKSRRDERGYNQLWQDSPSTAIRTKRRAEILAQALTTKPGGRILEVGSGNGNKAATVAAATNCHVTGLDLSERFTERATAANRGNRSVDFVCSSVSELADATPESYDAIYGDGILHHLVYDLARSLELFQKLLAPGGSLAFLEPNKANPYFFLAFNVEKLRTLTHLEPDENAFSKSFATSKFTSAGFRNVNVSYRDFLLPALPLPLVEPVVRVGAVLERTPVLRGFSQSLLITGTRSQN